MYSITSSIKFVVYPSLRGGWSAQAVPPEFGSFDKKIPFPKEWVGADKKTLNEILPGLTFVHSDRFLISAVDKDTAVKAAKMAIELNNESYV